MRLKLMAAGLLAVACAAPASALQIWPWGYLSPEGQSVQETDHFSASPETPYLNQTVTFTASPGKGLAVDCWLSQATFPQGDFTGAKLAGSEGQNPFDWICDQNTANTVWFAVRYRYITYGVTYDEAGGTTVADKSNLLYPDAFELADAPSRPGFIFGGWRDADGTVHAAGVEVSGASFSELDTVHEDGHTVTLTAQWTAVDYALAYDLAGGSAAADYPAQVAFGEVVRLAAPSRTGYDFAGWLLSGTESTARWGLTDDPQTIVSAGTAVGGGADATYFRNLTTQGGGTVRLTATWRARTITVEFNKQGGTGGTEGVRSYTYGSVPSPASVDPPSRSPDEFNGYWTEPEGQGRQLWTATGQWHDADAVWDIPSNIVVYAAWTLSRTRTVKFDSKFSTVQAVLCTIGEPFGQFFPTIVGTNATDVFLGWYSNETARVEADDPVPGGQYELLLTAHWDKETYCIAFDGNGATAGAMPVMTCQFDAVVSLPANAFVRTGYTFDHWRDESGTVTFADGQENLKNILDTGVRATNTLFAVWRTNEYVIVLDPNGGTGSAQAWRTVRYDEPVQLPTAAEVGFSREPFAFGGWSNAVSGVVYADLSAAVSNLCAEADGQITLLAVWRLSDLAEAMDCTNLDWKNSPDANEKFDSEWQVADGGHDTARCALQRPTASATVNPYTLTSSVITNSGTLSFYWQPQGNDGMLLFWIDDQEQPTDDPGSSVRERTGTDGVWSLVTTNLVVSPGERKYIHLANYDLASSVRVDLMTWTPEGRREPEAGKDEVTVSAAAFSADGTKFVLGFAGDSAFDYELLTNADLRVDAWGVLLRQDGADEVTFEAPVRPELPQLFYKVRTVPKP
ncbi:MAG: InlB B-repeat-containing protein [Kiritimatiellia bacterium]